MALPSGGHREFRSVETGATTSISRGRRHGGQSRRGLQLRGSGRSAEGGGSNMGGDGGNVGGSADSGGDNGGSRRRHEELSVAYEEEEARVINELSKKLEQVREEKIELENASEVEVERRANELSRELDMLRLANQDLEEQSPAMRAWGAGIGTHVDSSEGSSTRGKETRSKSNDTIPGQITRAMTSGIRLLENERDLNEMMVLDALRRENEQLRSRLVGTEMEYVRVKMLNEAYREELIDCRGRLGLPVDSLIGLTSVGQDQLSHSHSIHQHSKSGMAILYNPRFTGGGEYEQGESVASGITPLNSNSNTHSHPEIRGVPIPRPSWQNHQPIKHIFASFTGRSRDEDVEEGGNGISLRDEAPFLTSSSVSSGSLLSARSLLYPFSPSSNIGANLGSYGSVETDATSPPSSASFGMVGLAGHANTVGMGGVVMSGIGMGAYGVPQRGLSYPSVPPPSLSSSFGSPSSFSQGTPFRNASLIPVDPL